VEWVLVHQDQVVVVVQHQVKHFTDKVKVRLLGHVLQESPVCVLFVLAAVLVLSKVPHLQVTAEAEAEVSVGKII
tara:strand:- start:633 stop:857 length:225 start_codon:yes stop_codon:yes gene_type:complete